MKFLFWFLIGLVVLLPLVRWEGFMFASTFTKTMLFQIGVEIALVIWLWQGARLSDGQGLRHIQEIWRSRSFLFWALLAWLFTMLISTFFAYDPATAWWSGYERMMGMIAWLHLFVFLFLLVTIFREKYQWEKLFTAIALSGIVVALIGIGEKFFGSDIYSNVGSTLSNSAFLGSFLVFIFFITFGQLIKKEKFGADSIGWLLGLLSISLAILFTEARSALLGLLGGGFVIAVLVAWKGIEKPIMNISPRWMRRFAFLVIIFIIATGGLTFLLRDTLKDSSIILLSRVGSVFSNDRTGSGRLLAWGVGWEAFKEKPLLGWGIENFSFAFNAHYDPRLYNVEPWFDRGHNAIVDWGVITGVTGLFAYLAVLSAAFLIMVRKREYIFAGLLAASFAQNIFTFDILPTYIILFAVFAYAIAENRPTFNDLRARMTLNVGRVIALALMLAIFYFVIWSPLRENMIAQQAGEAFADGRDNEGYQLVEKALWYGTYGDIEARRLVAEYVFGFLKKSGTRDPEAMKNLYDFAIKKMEENTSAQPKDAKWPAYGAALGNLAYAHTGEIIYAERAAAAARESLALSPGRQQHWLELAQALLVQKKEEEYFEAMNTAIGLLSRYPIPHLNAAVGAIALGDEEHAAKEIEWLRAITWDIEKSKRDSWDNPIRDHEAIVQAYYKKTNYEKAIAFQKDLIAFLEKDITTGDTGATQKFIAQHIQLAALFKEAGRLVEARGVAETIKKLDPSLAGEAETFLRSLGL